jgi:hypothetical protein
MGRSSNSPPKLPKVAELTVHTSVWWTQPRTGHSSGDRYLRTVGVTAP